LAASYRYFPKGTVHVAVVDPGVGSARPAIAARTEKYFFIGPDNGVLSFALAREQIKAVHRLTNNDFFLQPVSRTFHGRDVFAPVAALLSRGVPIAKFGPRADGFVRLHWPEPRTIRAGIVGEIVYLDHFGNAITNLDGEGIRAFGADEVFVKRRRVGRLKEFYAAVARGRPVAVIGSSGLLEIAVNGGSAERAFRLKVGDPVRVCARP